MFGSSPAPCPRRRDFFIDNLMVRIHFIIVMIRWSGLAPWEFEFPFPGSLTFTFLVPKGAAQVDSSRRLLMVPLFRGSSAAEIHLNAATPEGRDPSQKLATPERNGQLDENYPNCKNIL